MFWWRRSHFVSTFRRAKHKESGSHIPLGDRRARSPGIECGYLRHRRIPGLLSNFYQTPARSVLFCFGGVGRTLCRPSAVRSTRNPVHILAAECVELARKQQGERIFTLGVNTRPHILFTGIHVDSFFLLLARKQDKYIYRLLKT